MSSVAVRILHPSPDPDAGPLTRWLADARGRLAERQRLGFIGAGGRDVEIAIGARNDAASFGGRLRGLVAGASLADGLVVLGSGSIPRATAHDRRSFLAAAAATDTVALANNRYSADIIAIPRIDLLPAIPDLPGDNALPRWLEEVAGYRIEDLRRRWRLAIDVDGPLDLLLLDPAAAPVDMPGSRVDTSLVRSRLVAVRRVAADRRAELVVSGRVSASGLAWLERAAAARVRAWVEERGLRASTPLARGEPGGAPARPPASILGSLLDRDGPGSLATQVTSFGDAALVDTRVLLAHRLGSDEAAWPVPEDRFASDLLLPERVHDPWLRDLTASAASARIPILLGGHTLVGPGVRLVVGGPTGGPRWS